LGASVNNWLVELILHSPSRNLLSAALTAVLIGYLTVWLPGPTAGLSFVGVELGEWIKFLGVGTLRDLFYLPPINLGLMLAVMTLTWPNQRWQTWVTRALAVGVALFSFPAIETIRFEPRSEWMLRLQGIGLVAVAAILSAWRLPQSLATKGPWLIMLLLGMVGAVLPTWAYLTVRPLVSQAVGLPVGIGVGVWLNGVGHLLVTAVSVAVLKQEVNSL
jgi:hypothetical protein